MTPPRKPEIVVYKGIEFRRYPDADQWSQKYYFVPGYRHRKNGVGRLHQEIWKDHYGPIPDGFVIHHIDNNPLNNDISNLEMVSHADHREIHNDLMPAWRRDWLRSRIKHIQQKAKNWHSTEDGRRWHSLNGKRVWETVPYRTKVCQYCEQEYRTRCMHGNERFCSNKCKSAYRRASGVDDEQRNCVRCAKPFMTNKYSKQRYCSGSCSSRHWRERKQDDNA